MHIDTTNLGTMYQFHCMNIYQVRCFCIIVLVQCTVLEYVICICDTRLEQLSVHMIIIYLYELWILIISSDTRELQCILAYRHSRSVVDVVLEYSCTVVQLYSRSLSCVHCALYYFSPFVSLTTVACILSPSLR